MRYRSILFAALLGVTACATPIVEDAGAITVDGREYVVQYVTFEDDSVGLDRRTFGQQTRTPPPYYQVIVDGVPYRCGSTRASCADAVRRAIANRGRDGDGGQGPGDDVYDGGT